MKKLNEELNHVRAMWGLRKGTTLIFNAYDLEAIGYMCAIYLPIANDNEAKE